MAGGITAADFPHNKSSWHGAKRSWPISEDVGCWKFSHSKKQGDTFLPFSDPLPSPRPRRDMFLFELLIFNPNFWILKWKGILNPNLAFRQNFCLKKHWKKCCKKQQKFLWHLSECHGYFWMAFKTRKIRWLFHSIRT